MDERSTTTRMLLPVAVAALATVGVACGTDETRTCAESSDVTACIVSRERGYRIEAEGLKPGSQLIVDQGEQPLVVIVGDDGKAPPPGQALGFVPDGGSLTALIEGTSRSGTPVTFRIECEQPVSENETCTPRIIRSRTFGRAVK